MQSDVRLALLDEPFRGMDRAQRTRLLGEARAWWKDATLLCVTHDVGETLAFDRVLVVEGGRIVEDDVPAHLAARQSRYRELLDFENTVRRQMWKGKQWRHIRIDNGRVELTAAPGPGHREERGEGASPWRASAGRVDCAPHAAPAHRIA